MTRLHVPGGALIFLALLNIANATEPPLVQPKRVLILHSHSRTLPITLQWERGISTGLEANIHQPVAIDVEYLAFERLLARADRDTWIDLLRRKYADSLPDVVVPGSDHGTPNWAPTIADLLRGQGYATGQFGKNHLGDRDKHLPTAHGFDEFFGNLYHLNAQEEPEAYYHPKDPEFKKRFGPRGAIHSYADGRIEDTGPSTRERMETADEEFAKAGLDFIDRAPKADKPFFVWMSTTRMQIWTRLEKEAEGRTDCAQLALNPQSACRSL